MSHRRTNHASPTRHKSAEGSSGVQLVKREKVEEVEEEREVRIGVGALLVLLLLLLLLLRWPQAWRQCVRKHCAGISSYFCTCRERLWTAAFSRL